MTRKKSTGRKRAPGRRVVIKFPNDELVESNNFRWTGTELLSEIEKLLGLTDAEPREIGKVFRPFAHGLSADLRQILKAAGFPNVDYVWGLAVELEDAAASLQLHEVYVPVPVTMIASVAAILTLLPGTQRGRPRDLSTDEAVKLAAETKSVRAAAKIIAARTGKSEGTVRSNIRSAKRRSKNRGTSTESS